MSFPIQDLIVEGASKTEIAQKLADWFVQQSILVPVYDDHTHKRRTFYGYGNKTGRWKQASIDYAYKIGKHELGNEFTRHTRQELANQIKYHPKALLSEDLGLPENEILCREGKVYNLDTGKIRNIKKSDYALHMINADPDQEGEIEEFLQLLKDTIPDEKQRKTFQEFLGWCLRYPNNDHEKSLLILGETNSGKSTLLEIVYQLFKHCHTSRVSVTQIAAERTFHVPKLADSIVNIDEDMSSAEIKQGSVLKKVISQEKVFVEEKGQPGFELNPVCKFMTASNVSPNPSTKDDPAFYQRFLTLEAPHTVPEDEQDKQLVEKLTTRERLNGLFHWALEGLERLEEQGTFTYSPSIIETRKKWDEYGSDVQKFISECVNKKKGNHVPTMDVYEYYELWAMDQLGDNLEASEFIGEMKKNPRIQHGRVERPGGSRRSCFKHIEIEISG